MKKLAYSIKQVSELLGISIYTLRYYEQLGILDHVERDAHGWRQFSREDILVLNTVECLKQTGMPLKEIKYYVDLVAQGLPTVAERLQMFEKQQAKVDKQLAELQARKRVIDMKVKYYQTAVDKGSLDVCHDEKSELIRKLLHE